MRRGKTARSASVFSVMNPQGCTVTSFKVPSAVEAAHDFLWRCHAAVPARGQVALFNRSHYEDVLVVRVHNLVPKKVWSRRYDHINAFEELLYDNHTQILKFYLHIDREEQLERFGKRIDDPAKQWKISDADYSEREYWDDYTAGVSRRVGEMQHETRSVVCHSLEPQVVSEPGHRSDRRRHAEGHGHAVPGALGRYAGDSQEVPRGVRLTRFIPRAARFCAGPRSRARGRRWRRRRTSGNACPAG